MYHLSRPTYDASDMSAVRQQVQLVIATNTKLVNILFGQMRKELNSVTIIIARSWYKSR